MSIMSKKKIKQKTEIRIRDKQVKKSLKRSIN